MQNLLLKATTTKDLSGRGSLRWAAGPAAPAHRGKKEIPCLPVVFSDSP
jgi:hypothetical protein